MGTDAKDGTKTQIWSGKCGTKYGPDAKTTSKNPVENFLWQKEFTPENLGKFGFL